jgi:hypothetical protein
MRRNKTRSDFMIEDKALVHACLLKVSGGHARELDDYQILVLKTAGLIQPYDVQSTDDPKTARTIFNYRLTRAGEACLWPPEEK